MESSADIVDGGGWGCELKVEANGETLERSPASRRFFDIKAPAPPETGAVCVCALELDVGVE